MAYESPKQIRRRQQRAEDKPARRTRQPRTIKTFNDYEWVIVCEFHVGRIQEQINAGHAESAGRHAQFLAHAAVYRRAQQIMRDQHCGYVKAERAAKLELYNCEI